METKNVNVRIPAPLHERAVATARAAHRSLNAQILYFMEQGIQSEPGEPDTKPKTRLSDLPREDIMALRESLAEAERGETLDGPAVMRELFPSLHGGETSL